MHVLPLALEIDPYEFACDGPLWGIPHFWNVVSNLPYLLVGAFYLRRIRRLGVRERPGGFNWIGIWISTALVCLGSGAYHWTLTPWGLAFDRVAICGIIGFLGAHAAHVTLGIGPSWRVTLACLVVAEGTVIYWCFGGTAWVYGALQGLGGLAILGLFLFAQRAGRLGIPCRPIYWMTMWYALAKLVEAADVPVCEWTGFIGGHPIKHVFAAIGLWCLGAMMEAECEHGIR